MKHKEDAEQSKFFTLLRWKHATLYEIAFHIPNGGKRSLREAVRLKAQGVKAGIPDIFVPVACGDFVGLFIEMKRPKELGTPKPQVSKEQVRMMGLLEAQGYRCVVAYGADEAISYLEEYLQHSKFT